MRDDDVFIYILKDPSTNKVIYVGKSNDPKRRLFTHISDARRKREIDRLILEILDAGSRPTIEIVEKCNHDNWQEREQYWIKCYSDNGSNIANISRGGKDPRPLNYIAKNRGRFNLFLRDDQRDMLREIAAKSGHSASWHMRKAINNYLEKYHTERKGTNDENSQPNP